MQRSTLALLIGTTLLLCAGAVLVPQLLQDDEPSPLRWTEAEEVEVPVDADVAIATAGADAVERTSVEASAEAWSEPSTCR